MKNKSKPLTPQKDTPSASSEQIEAPDQDDVVNSDDSDITTGIPVVGLGGSAGSLEPFKQFLCSMPADSGAAFVIIQHLSPAHKSLLSELLAQHTAMKVFEAQNGMFIEPNCVYVIPPNAYLGIRDGLLFLAEPVAEHGVRMPIDFFFRMLAENRRDMAVGILFSGAGSDGTMGVRALRGVGGLTIIQDETAAFTDMPRSAMASGQVDLVLPPEKMGQAVADYFRQLHIRKAMPADVQAEARNEGVRDIICLLLAKTGCDFCSYKRSTILRRIERRMNLAHIQDVAIYLDLLRHDDEEINQLRRDLLINVTNFFRDHEAFEDLRRQIFDPMIRARKADEPIRIWIPGCSSGEEAYSLGMLLLEATGAAFKPFPIQIFATDIDEEALQFARIGLYPESVIADVGAARYKKFFVSRPKGVQVIEPLRKMIVFASQNLVTDPPFSKMDLISCRNLMIYLNHEIQGKLISLFNFALNPGGILFLGKSEGIVGRTDLFESLSKGGRIYRRLAPPRPVVLDTPSSAGKGRPSQASHPGKTVSSFYFDAIRHVLLSHFAASVVLVDKAGQILQFHGQSGKYLNLPSGEPVLNLLEIAKEGLTWSLRSAMYRAFEEGAAVVMENVSIDRGENSPFVRLTVSPIALKEHQVPIFAVIFEDVIRPESAVRPVPSETETETVIKQLEDELRVTQKDLQSSIQDLQSANEEMISSNEELQSTIEELETSREELQSLNEEMTTVNGQLQEKVEKLDKANNDMANFLESTQIATLFLDCDLRVKLFTPALTRILNMIPSDVGRSFMDLSVNFSDCDLLSIIRTVIQNGATLESESRHANGQYYIVRVMPYKNPTGAVSGVVATFNDVTRLRRAEQQIRRLAVVVKDSNDAVILAEFDGRIHAWNRGAQKLYGWSEEEALGMKLSDITPADRDRENAQVRRLLMAGETVVSFETQRRTKEGRLLEVWLTATLLRDESGHGEMIATTERDVTERKNEEQRLRHLTQELGRSNEELKQITYIASHDLQEPLRMIGSFLTLLKDRYGTALDEKGHEYIQFAVGGAKRMAQLIHDLLDYSQIQRDSEQYVPVEMELVLEKALDNCREGIMGEGAAVTHTPLPMVKGNETQLVCLMQNLVSNAIKFHRPDVKPAVHVSAKLEAGFWLFQIQDNGIGISKEYADRIFRMFERLHTQDEYPGSGIGLAICKKIVEGYGGRIWFESEPGKGSTFFFTMPNGKE
jgi:two-component system CheB/CheR fusion protein